jgi:hypothetical protein
LRKLTDEGSFVAAPQVVVFVRILQDLSVTLKGIVAVLTDCVSPLFGAREHSQWSERTVIRSVHGDTEAAVKAVLQRPIRIIGAIVSRISWSF